MTLKRFLSLTLCLIMLCGAMPVALLNTSAEETDTYKAGDIIEFGSYPQREVVSQTSDSGVSGKGWEAEGDCTADADLYDTLKNLSEDQWNTNGDATVGENKYRRIKESDATTSKTDEAEYYSWSSSDTYHYFIYEPIKWRVLEQNGSDIFLLAETVLDCQMYNTNITGELTWETSTLRSWLNGYDSSKNAYGTDYSNGNFINTAFTSDEQSQINTTTYENKDNSKSGTEGGNDTSDRIFVLSEDEVYGSTAVGYGFAEDYDTNDTARQAKSSTYAKAMGVGSNDSGNCFWWLRTPGSYPGLFILIRDTGSVFRGGQHANSKTRGVRPAMYITLQDEDENKSEDKKEDNTDDYIPNQNAVISTGNGTVDYRTIVTLKATASGMDADSFLAIYDGNTRLATGDKGVGSVTFCVGEMKNSKTYTVKIIDENGNIQTDGNGTKLEKEITVNVDAGFFKIIIAFFRGLFDLLPTETI